MPTTEDLRDAYNRAFSGSEDDSVRRNLQFADRLAESGSTSSDSTSGNRRRRWLMTAGAAAGVAAVTITAVILVGQPDARQVPTGVDTATTTQVPVELTPVEQTPSGQTSGDITPSAELTEAPQVVQTADVPMTPQETPQPAETRESAQVPQAVVSETETSAPFEAGYLGVEGPLAVYADPQTYNYVPDGLAVRSPVGEAHFDLDGNVLQFTVHIAAPNSDPKMVVGGYLVVVSQPGEPFNSSNGASVGTPAGAPIELGGRSWQWNSDHTVLISQQADSALYIGVLSDGAMNEFAAPIPTGYSATEIEAIAAGLQP